MKARPAREERGSSPSRDLRCRCREVNEEYGINGSRSWLPCKTRGVAGGEAAAVPFNNRWRREAGLVDITPHPCAQVRTGRR